MKTPITITMCTSIERQGHQDEEIKIDTVGQFYKKDKHVYLQFFESSQDYGNVNQVIKIEGSNRITIQRHGDVSMKQAFHEDQTTEGVYHTTFGQLLMETTTNKMHITTNHEKVEGTIFFTYQLTVQNDFAGKYHVKIKYRRDHS
ncbi:MAG: DUF1934 domain-containing protein [Bacillaceae bacterium]|nr:DUF1934 domain-containing protein [Bacillaceae bacterium]